MYICSSNNNIVLYKFTHLHTVSFYTKYGIIIGVIIMNCSKEKIQFLNDRCLQFIYFTENYSKSSINMYNLVLILPCFFCHN
jgi:hypothetical protein